jgi:hypothetical protein
MDKNPYSAPQVGPVRAGLGRRTRLFVGVVLAAVSGVIAGCLFGNIGAASALQNDVAALSIDNRASASMFGSTIGGISATITYVALLAVDIRSW